MKNDLQSIGVNELSRRSRKTHRRAQDEVSAMEQSSRLASVHQGQQFQHAVREHQRLARGAVSQAILDSPARFETSLSLELKQAQFHNESTMQQRERVMVLRLGNEAQDARRQRRTR